MTSDPFAGYWHPQPLDARPGIVNASPVRSLRMRTMHNLIGKARDHTFSVIILGETGTGKELVARCIHNSGPRKHSAFVAVDCSSLTPTLIESELFGYMRGAFTGADTNKKGLVEPPNTATLFLDKI